MEYSSQKVLTQWRQLSVSWEPEQHSTSLLFLEVEVPSCFAAYNQATDAALVCEVHTAAHACENSILTSHIHFWYVENASADAGITLTDADVMMLQTVTPKDCLPSSSAQKSSCCQLQCVCWYLRFLCHFAACMQRAITSHTMREQLTQCQHACKKQLHPIQREASLHNVSMLQPLNEQLLILA